MTILGIVTGLAVLGWLAGELMWAVIRVFQDWGRSHE